MTARISVTECHASHLEPGRSGCRGQGCLSLFGDPKGRGGDVGRYPQHHQHEPRVPYHHSCSTPRAFIVDPRSLRGLSESQPKQDSLAHDNAIEDERAGGVVPCCGGNGGAHRRVADGSAAAGVDPLRLLDLQPKHGILDNHLNQGRAGGVLPFCGGDNGGSPREVHESAAELRPEGQDILARDNQIDQDRAGGIPAGPADNGNM
ncbi:Aste57867_23763 [Aphanomyces stellatus]|uniref:Aste57867_23763 protein n=1 Tax=Aphanomyces stellatus TaxID=120398 RepID=A0A485LQF3_9STRA|nr:hypothetical protein As57867_023691 [Aphanomyces stellatus]VFU00408.1 Aste57867_23763 [Aphanomyces stellatus]